MLLGFQVLFLPSSVVLLFSFIFKNTCLCVCELMQGCQHRCEGQDSGNQFSPSTEEVLGIELRSSGLAAGSISLYSAF